jgi:hypothetical protein
VGSACLPARRPNASIHHANSAIELILQPLGPKPLRAPQPSVSLFIVIIIVLSKHCDRVPLPAGLATNRVEAVFKEN